MTQRRPASCVTEALDFQIKGCLVEDSVPRRQGPYLCQSLCSPCEDPHHVGSSRAAAV